VPDPNVLPDDHVLKPLELRLLEMADDVHPAARVLMGNAVAALRVFANERPGLVDLTHSDSLTDLELDLCCAAVRTTDHCVNY
jgi:hypothetical protein